MVAGVAAAGDIRSSFARGRLAPAALEPIPGSAAVAPEEGRELAARLGLTARDECRTIELRFRPGCLDHVAALSANAADPLDLPL